MMTMTHSQSEDDKLFRAWVESLPDTHWAKYDLSACRLGWDAGRKEFEALLDEFWEMRTLPFDQFKGAMLNRLREFSKPKHDAIKNPYACEKNPLFDELPFVECCEHGKALNDYCKPCGRIHSV
jgi:hypothetical protein